MKIQSFEQQNNNLREINSKLRDEQIELTNINDKIAGLSQNKEIKSLGAQKETIAKLGDKADSEKYNYIIMVAGSPNHNNVCVSIIKL